MRVGNPIDHRALGLVAHLERDRLEFDPLRFDFDRAASWHPVDAVEHLADGTKVAAFGEFEQAARDPSVQRHAVFIVYIELPTQFDSDRPDADRSARGIPRVSRHPSPARIS